MTLEIARLERISPDEQRSVLEEFYGLGLRRLRFVFEDLVKLDDTEIREAYHAEDARDLGPGPGGGGQAGAGRKSWGLCWRRRPMTFDVALP